MILYSHQIYELIAPALSLFQRKNPFRENEPLLRETKRYDMIIFGIGRFGRNLANMLDKHPEISYLGIDLDPGVVKEWKKRGKDIVYGDMEDPELLDKISFQGSKLIVSTVANYQLSRQLMRSLKRNNYQGRVYLTALTEKDYRLLLTCGAEEVLMPHQMAAANFYSAYIKDQIFTR